VTPPRAPSRLGSSQHLKGEISGNEDLDIDGTVEGLVHIDEGKLTVGATAKLTADIIAGEVIVYGNVQGNVRGKAKIEIKKSGSVNGDLTTAQIIIEDGAYFKGSMEIEQSAEKRRRQKRVLANSIYTGYAGGGRGAEEYLITKVEYIFLFVVCRAIISPMHMAKGVRS
jgi:cytoskeletal protein CcmA (bactofilin family)